MNEKSFWIEEKVRKVTLLEFSENICPNKHRAKLLLLWNCLFVLDALKPTYKEQFSWMKPNTKPKVWIWLESAHDMKDHFNYAIKWFSRVIYGPRAFKCFFCAPMKNYFILLIYWMVNGHLDVHLDVLFPLLLFQFLFESRYGIWVNNKIKFLWDTLNQKDSLMCWSTRTRKGDMNCLLSVWTANRSRIFNLFLPKLFLWFFNLFLDFLWDAFSLHPAPWP